ncbi:DNA-directed RNA polymerase subunit delta [Selenomonas artemidis]|jgi:DNA-directed RNA polymerase delta subunit|uniref:DNA-directed RNA polymerase subunit delta n=1 Tax=Selenomonas artemidis TaxID=671224 RepID=UPI000417FAC6|nr:DNA-directed RNA polymerase subunit delta [Selenomonas artemidis]
MDFEHMSEMDVAYHILTEKKESVQYKELILAVIEAKHKPVQSLSAAISEIYTMMNMDSRFHYEGEGKWGLTEWVPPEVKRSSSRSVGTAKSGVTKETMRKKKLESIQN